MRHQGSDECDIVETGRRKPSVVPRAAINNLRHWIGAHVRTFEFFVGCLRVLVPDNLKAGVTKPYFYEPDLNPTYHELAKQARLQPRAFHSAGSPH